MKTTPRLLTAEERSAIMSEAMTKWWADRREAKAKAERKAKREAKKAETEKMASGVKVKLPRGTKVEGGKIKLNKNVGRPLPAQYAAKTKRTWRKAG